MLSELDVRLPRSRPATVHTDEDMVAFVHRLAVHYPDAVMAGILNRQGRTTARGLRFTVNHVGNVRRPHEAHRGRVRSSSPMASASASGLSASTWIV